MTILLLLGGLILLIAGAESLVRGASRLALGLGLSPLIIGLTVVAIGTSSPELAVSLHSSIIGQSDIVIGNVLGSNIFNILLILGLSGAIAPLMVTQKLIKLDIPVLILVSAALLMMCLDGSVGLVDGLVLLASGIVYIIYSAYSSFRENNRIKAEYRAEYGFRNGKQDIQRKWYIQSAFVIAGLGMLILGSRWLVGSAVSIARYLGISEMIIGLTIIAAGTSLPELATSVLASIRGERDIAVGNVVGSNLMNIMIILGLSAVIAPGGLSVEKSTLRFDLPIMVTVAFACFPVFFSGQRISRWEGLLFISYYIIYVLYLVLETNRYASLSQFSWVMAGFVIPLTIITLMVIAAGYYRKNQKARCRNQKSDN